MIKLKKNLKEEEEEEEDWFGEGWIEKKKNKTLF